MPCNLFPHAYEKLIDEDIEWLKANSPDSLERDHILIALDFSKREYRARGYDEAMHKTGPHFPLAATQPSEGAKLADAQAPAGFRLVPVDATDEMVAAAEKVNFENEDTTGTLHNIWHTMLAAAPIEARAQKGGD